MKLVFALPSSTANANKQLTLIYKRAKLFKPDCVLASTLQPDCVNITYGYLGMYANFFFSGQLSPLPFSIRSSFILDHAYAPSSLKGKVFRLSKMNEHLSSVIFHHKFLSAAYVDSIYEHLKTFSDTSSVSLTIPINTDISNDTRYSLLIKKSSVLSRFHFGRDASSLTNEWLRKFIYPSVDPSCSSRPKGIVSIKQTEAAFTPRSILRFRYSNFRKASVNFSNIDSVFSPTSMFVIPFILHSIPVRLSMSHPLHFLFGDYIPALNKVEALDLVMHAILKSSFSEDSFSELTDYLGYSLRH